MNLTIEQNAELENLVQARQKIKTEIDNLETIRKDYDQKIIDLIGTTGTYPTRNHKVTITASTRIESRKIEKHYPPLKYPQFYSPKVDPAKVKTNMPPEQLTQMQTTTAATVRISNNT